MSALQKSEPLQLGTTPTPADLLQIAVSQGADIAKLEQLMALQERWEANQARKAYVVAMTDFKANPPEILKTKLVAFSGTSYHHATLADVTQLIVGALAKHGLSHRWDLSQEGPKITVTCVITHSMGHSESTPFSCVADDSGKKNAIQAIGSAITYAQRYTLLAATGLATKDMDDDGRKTETVYVSDEQAATLRDMVDATGADLPKFLTYMQCESIGEIPAEWYQRALSILKAKEKAKSKGAKE